jgi:leader peptidase (prepilin peptidase)/N-methyltransferase
VDSLATWFWTFAAVAFLWGAIWGSFLNVVIWRLPRGQSLSRPASACPQCGHAIRWYDNVPILGWLWLRAKCRDCRAPISGRYPFVEALVGVLSFALWFHVAHDRFAIDEYGLPDPDFLKGALVHFLVYFYFIALLVSMAFIDLDLTILPDKLTKTGIVWGLVGALLTDTTGVWSGFYPAIEIQEALIGAVVGGGFVWVVFSGYAMVRGIEGGGGGDVWMMAMIGATLGWMSVPFVLMLASMQGLVAAVGASLLARSRGQEPGSGAGLLIQGAHTEEYWKGRIGGKPVEEDAAALATEPEAKSPVDESSDAPPLARATEEEDDGFMQLAVPFGPFLALGAIEFVFVGGPLLRWLSGGYLP